MDINKERKKISKKFNLLIGTPGRINDHLRKKYLTLSQLSFLVLDEADEMLDLGFKEDLEAIIQSSSINTRKLLFSATFLYDLFIKHICRYLLVISNRTTLLIEQTEIREC